MTTVALTGVASRLGTAVLDVLDADPGVPRVIGLDLRPPAHEAPSLELRHVDLRDPGVAEHLRGVDALVHLAAVSPDEEPGERLAAVVDGTRTLLAAAGSAGVRTVVVRSSTLAYGARPDNPVPLSEGEALRAPPTFAPGHHARMVEELVGAFATAHPDVRVVVLRPAPVLADDEYDRAVLHRLESPLLALVADHDPPVQLCDLDDLARAVHLALDDGAAMQGPYNVAADGWLTVAELARLLGHPRLHLPEAPALWLADRLADLGVLEGGEAWVRYLMYPWVVDTRRLHGAGWHPSRSNREIVREFCEQHADVWRVGGVRLSRGRLAWSAATGAAVAATGATLVAAWALWRWRR